MEQKLYVSAWREMPAEVGSPSKRLARYSISPDNNQISIPVVYIWSKTKGGKCRWHYDVNYRMIYQVAERPTSARLTNYYSTFRSEYKFFDNKSECVEKLDAMLQKSGIIILKNSLMPFL